MNNILLSGFIVNPIKILADEILALIPSILGGDDGPHLESLVLISNNYLCEIRLISEKEDFDIVAKGSITNYRFKYSELTVTDANDKEINYEVGSVELYHDLGIGTSTVINYIGMQRQEWIDSIINALPLSFLAE